MNLSTTSTSISGDLFFYLTLIRSRLYIIEMLQAIINGIFGSQHERDIKALLPILHKVNEKEAWALSLSKDDFPLMTAKFKERYKNGESLDSLLPEAYALVREAARRTLGERPYDVQMLGSIVLHSGRIVEMKTGEGKTLMSVGAAYLNSLTCEGVHVVTVNDYLAERDANWMRPIYSYLGVTVGSILSMMDNDVRKAAYACDITYGTNNEFGFDYLRDNMHMDLNACVQRKHNYCVVDEIDSILIDEARTPLIISGATDDDTSKFAEVEKLVGALVEVAKDPQTGEYPNEDEGEILVGDYKVEEKNKRISFTQDGMTKIEELLMKRGLIKDSLYNEDNFEYIHYFTQAVKAHILFHMDVDYVVQEGKVQIVDEFTGRILYGRRYSDGLHEAIEAKERIKVANRNRTLATITFQNYFRMYKKIAGMTGTADTEGTEFAKIYNLEVVVIPTNRPVARLDEDDLVFLNEDDKFNAIADEIVMAHEKSQPVLVGTVSIEKSEKLSRLLTKKGIRHEVLNAKNHAREALIISEAGAAGSVTIATNMAGRGTDIKLGGNPEFRARRKAGTEATKEQFEQHYKKEFETWKDEYQKVKESGGLYVLGTERHESRRIDNQLRGRSGRQGDPGRSRFFISLDDDLMRLFGGENLKGLMKRIGMDTGEPIFHPLLNKTLENAQKKVEDRNFEIRKHLLEYDDVLNEQRKFIYDQRLSILSDTNIRQRCYDTALDMVSDELDEYTLNLKNDTSNAIRVLNENLKLKFNILVDLDPKDKASQNTENVKTLIASELTENMNTKIEYAGEDSLNMFLRFQYLQVIDQYWLDHLESLEALREAVSLRAYAQKNPLLEYKLEGFSIFDSLIANIREQVASRLFLVRVKKAEERTSTTSKNRIANASHNEVNAFSGMGGRESNAAKPEQVQIVRSVPKVGRNDACPCGSGKKYKHCHGA